MASRTSSANKKAKYQAHPAIAAANKIRKMKKHVKQHPNDMQTASKIVE